MIRSSRHHKCALIFCAVSLMFLGGGIAASGFIHEFLSPYDAITSPDVVYFTYTQYWLGIPAFVLGLYILMLTICCKVKCLFVFGFVFSALVLVTSVCSITLHGSAWRRSLHAVMVVNDKNCEDDSVGHCTCGNFDPASPVLSCHEIKYVAVLQSVITIFSGLVILFCQFCCFVYCRILGWLLHVVRSDVYYYLKTLEQRGWEGDGTNYYNTTLSELRDDNPIDYYAKTVGTHYTNGYYIGRANEVVLNKFN